MTQILDDPAMRTPAMMYLFHRVEERLDGTAAIIVVDEGWKALDDDVFVRRIKDWEKTIRKRNGIVGFATQSAQDALESRIASAIIEQAATQIFMANPKARADDYIDGFGLTPHEYELVRTLPDNAHCFLIKHGAESVVARLNLTGERDLLTILSGPRAHRAAARRDPRRDAATIPPTGSRACWRWHDGGLPAAAARRRLPRRACSTIVDCQAQTIGAAAIRRWPRRARPCRWSLTGLLTLFVALFGYRMLFGQTPGRARRRAGAGQDRHRAGAGDQLARLPDPGLRRRLHGPAELAGEIGRPAGLARRRRRPGRPARQCRPRPASRSPMLGTGRSAPPADAAAAAPAGQPVAPPPVASFDALALGGARMLFLTGAIGALAAVRLVAGLLLALGPFFIAFLLFDGDARACSKAGCACSAARRSARSARRSCSASSWRCSSPGSPT